MTPDELKECENTQKANLEKMLQDIGNYDMVVLDEVLAAISTGMIEKSLVLGLIQEKPEKTEVVLTGRNAPDDLIELADYVSDIRCVKHPYNKGICGRKGVEF